MEMNNRFFNLALSKAARLAGRPGRLLKLVTEIFFKIDRTQLSGKNIKEQILLMGRLVKAYARGHYREIPLKSLLPVVAALLYFLNPFDLIPDALIGIGLTDDVALLTWVFKTIQDELNKFKAWEGEIATTTTKKSDIGSKPGSRKK
jgi:uncharacterized membrane protein YkvA (DUF1232 family)